MEGFYKSAILLFLAVMLGVLLHRASVRDARDIYSFLNDNFLASSGHGDHGNSQNVKKWAVLVAGSNEFTNYRHQADVCHAYQILKAGGLKDENIIVFMYDDIAYNPENPTQGLIKNSIHGPNVYQGVPKDYTGEHVTKANFYNVTLGNRAGVTGGSGKVLDSGPDDHIFIYYADHGSPGSLSMPTTDDYVFADEFINVLTVKHDMKSYSKMVIYVSACYSGSMFDGLLPEDLNIYVTTSANPNEKSYACYYDGELNTFLGSSYSVSWMEDSEAKDLTKETLEEQYQAVKLRVGTQFTWTSHVMQYGTMEFRFSTVSDFLGSNTTKKTSAPDEKSLVSTKSHFVIPQRDVKLYLLGQKYLEAPWGSTEMYEAKHQLDAEISHRERVDETMKQMINAVFGSENATAVLLGTYRPAGEPLVDDWDCFKSMVKTYEKHCGKLSTYGKQYTRAMANMCNSGIRPEQVESVASVVCGEQLYPQNLSKIVSVSA